MLKDALKGWLQGVFQGSLVSLCATLMMYLVAKLIVIFAGDTKAE